MLECFVFAVKRNYFRNLEDAKYQMFWSDVEELVESGKPKKKTRFRFAVVRSTPSPSPLCP